MTAFIVLHCRYVRGHCLQHISIEGLELEAEFCFHLEANKIAIPHIPRFVILQNSINQSVFHCPLIQMKLIKYNRIESSGTVAYLGLWVSGGNPTLTRANYQLS